MTRTHHETQRRYVPLHTRPEITVEQNYIGEYVAWFGDLDLDVVTGSGKTPLDAIVNLLDWTE